MTFPVTVEFKDQRAKIYRPAKEFPFYRVAFRADGKRKMLTFGTYTEAKEAAEAKVRELHRNPNHAALTTKQSREALTVRDMLTAHFRETGLRVSLLEAVSSQLSALKLLPPKISVIEAAREYAKTHGQVKPKLIAEAVADFIAARRAKPKPNERARFSPVYARNVETWLTKFSGTFPAHMVLDLAPELVEKYFEAAKDLSPKARNDRRAAIGMWLRWCGRKDFIAPGQLHKLLECDAMRAEQITQGKIKFYAAEDLEKILSAILDRKNEACNEASRPALCAVTVLQAFGGARQEEALRLRWEDLQKEQGVEISGEHAKTRRRRLLEVQPVLAQWLALFKGRKGKIWDAPVNSFITQWARARESVNVGSKKNGLRHGFISFSYVRRGEIETSALAGTSPQILHSNYRGLATKAEAEKWFNVFPPQDADNIIVLHKAGAA